LACSFHLAKTTVGNTPIKRRNKKWISVKRFANTWF
jgi:hypothetical protein